MGSVWPTQSHLVQEVKPDYWSCIRTVLNIFGGIIVPNHYVLRMAILIVHEKICDTCTVWDESGVDAGSADGVLLEWRRRCCRDSKQ